MTVEYCYRADWNCLLVQPHGKRSPREYQRMVAAVKADRRIRPGYLRFSSMRLLTSQPSAEFLRILAGIMDDMEAAKSVKRAAILVREDVQFGLLRLYQAHLDDSQDKVRVFRSLAEAYDWLGLLPDTPDPFTSPPWRPDWSTAHR